MNKSTLCSWVGSTVCWGLTMVPSANSVSEETGLPEGMVYIPAGEALIGTREEEAELLAREYAVHPGLFLLEAPQRVVTLEAFWIDRFPVTNAQYQAFVQATGHRSPWGPEGFPPDCSEHPVTDVTWDDAAAYAQWAGKRLPTAEEWEKAARGPEGRLYPWGNEWNEEATCLHDPRSPRTEALTAPVGSFPQGASPYGVFDLCGNVAEWTATEATPADAQRGWAWYVIKGAGAAQSQRYHFRGAARALSAHQSRTHSWLGFRCALEASGEPPRESVQEPSTRSVPRPPLPEGPREELYLRDPIRLENGPMIRVPYFPDGYFGLSLPEQVGAEGWPFGWEMKHTRSPWQITEDGRQAEYEATFEGQEGEPIVRMRVTLQAGLDHVDFTIALHNLTDQPFRQLYSNTCLQGWRSPYFEDSEQARTFIFTDEGPTETLQMPPFPPGEPLHRGWSLATAGEPSPRGGTTVRWPIMLTVSNDGRWVMAQAYGEGVSVAGNAHYSCLHVRPRWPDLPAREERALTGKLYFLRGGAEELLTRWKKDFGQDR